MQKAAQNRSPAKQGLARWLSMTQNKGPGSLQPTKHAGCKGLYCRYCIRKNRAWMLDTTYSRHILDLVLI